VLRIGALAGAVIIAVWGAFWDRMLHDSDQAQVAGRLALAAFMLAVVSASFSRAFLRYYDWCTGASVVAVIAAVTALLLRLPEGDSFATGVAILATGIVASIGRLRAPAMALCALGILATHGAQIRAHGLRAELVFRHLSFLAVMAGYAVWASHRAYRSFVNDRLLLAERERASALSQDLLRSERARLSWLENVAGFLRHELKNQLVALDTSLRLMEDGLGDARSHEYWNRARRSCDLTRRLIASATEASDLESALASLEPEPLDFSRLVAEYVALFESDEKPRLRASIEPGCHVVGCELRLTQLLDKLLQNAVEHSREAGEVRVVVEGVGAAVHLRVENQGDRLPADAARIFDPFVSTKERSRHPESLGLGLYVAKRIVVHHGGTIEAVPLEPPGARFVVALPRLAQASSSGEGRLSKDA
jgi:signal transduction histidine kinase